MRRRTGSAITAAVGVVAVAIVAFANLAQDTAVDERQILAPAATPAAPSQDVPEPSAPAAPVTTEAGQALAQLDQLTIAEPFATAYERTYFGQRWADVDYKAIGHMNKPLTEPAPTVVAKANVSLVTLTKRPRIEATMEQIDAVDVNDYRFRMLQWREHANAQRFPRDYVFKGNGSVNTLHAGNAVAANVACYLGYMCRIALGDLTSAQAGYEWLELAA